MFTNVDGYKLLLNNNSARTMGNDVKDSLDSTKFFFTNDVVREWSKLPLSVVQCDTILLKHKLDHHLLQQGLR